MQWTKSIVESASFDFIDRDTTRRESQLKIEEDFDKKDAAIVSAKCGERVLIEVFKTRSELNREISRNVASSSFLDRKDVNVRYLNLFDRFYQSVGENVDAIRMDEDYACTDLIRTIEYFNQYSAKI